MAVQESIKVDNDGWYFHADKDGAGAKLILRHYTSDTAYTEHGEFRTFAEAASGYLDAKYASSVASVTGASLATVMDGKKMMLETFLSGFSGGAIRSARIYLNGGG